MKFKKEVVCIAFVLMVMLPVSAADVAVDLKLSKNTITLEESMTFTAKSFISDILVLSVPMDLTVQDPHGMTHDVVLTGHINGDYIGSFRPESVGLHKAIVTVYIDDNEYTRDAQFNVTRDSVDFTIDVENPVYTYGPLEINGTIRIYEDDQPVTGVIEIFLASESSPFYQELCRTSCAGSCQFSCILTQNIELGQYLILAKIKHNNDYQVTKNSFLVQIHQMEDLNLSVNVNTENYADDTVTINLNAIYDSKPFSDALVNMKIVSPDDTLNMIANEIIQGTYSYSFIPKSSGDYQVQISLSKGNIFGMTKTEFSVVDRPNFIIISNYSVAHEILTGKIWLVTEINLSTIAMNYVTFNDRITDNINYSQINLRTGNKVIKLNVTPKGVIVPANIIFEKPTIEAVLMEPQVPANASIIKRPSVIDIIITDNTLVRVTVPLEEWSLPKYVFDENYNMYDWGISDQNLSFYAGYGAYSIFYQGLHEKTRQFRTINYSLINVNGQLVPYLSDVRNTVVGEGDTLTVYSNSFVEIKADIWNKFILPGDTVKLTLNTISLDNATFEGFVRYPNGSTYTILARDEIISFQICVECPNGYYILELTSTDVDNVKDIYIEKFYVSSSTPSIIFYDNNSRQGERNSKVIYSHTLKNDNHLNSDLIEFEVKSNFTTFLLYNADGTILRDSNRNGLQDIKLGPGESTNITAEVLISPNSVIGSVDTLMITAISSTDNTVTATVHDKTTIGLISERMKIKNDIAVQSISELDHRAVVTVTNHDLIAKNVNILLNIDIAGNISEEIKTVFLEPDTTTQAVFDVRLADNYYARADLLDLDGEQYLDDSLGNNYLVKWVHYAWYDYNYSSRIPFQFRELLHIDHDEFIIKMYVELPEETKSVVPIFFDGEYKRADYRFINYDSDTNSGILLMRLKNIGANVQGTGYLYLDTENVQDQADFKIDTINGRIETNGRWVRDSQIKGYHGKDYMHDLNLEKGKKNVQYYPGLELDNYEIFTYYPSYDRFADNVPVLVHGADVDQYIELNQQIDGGQWNYIGAYSLDKDSYVSLETFGTEGLVVADAFKFRKVSFYSSAGEPELYENGSILRGGEIVYSPEFLATIPKFNINLNISINSNLTINLLEYFEYLTYITYNSTNNTLVVFDENIAMILPVENFTGITEVSFNNNVKEMRFIIRVGDNISSVLFSDITANLSNNETLNWTSNVTKNLLNLTSNISNTSLMNQSMEVEIETVPATQLTARVGQPVKWVKQVFSSDNQTVKLPVEASSIVVLDKNNITTDQNLLTIKIGNRTLNLSEHDTINEIRKLKIDKQEVKKERENTPIFSGLGTRKFGMMRLENSIQKNITELEENLEENIGQINITDDEVELEIGQEGSYVIEYETDAPQKEETLINESLEVFVYSNVSIHYYNVYVNVSLPYDIAISSNLTLFHWINDTKMDVGRNPDYDVSFTDIDGDNISDYVEWYVPQLSGQLFEVGEGAGLGFGIASATRDAPNTLLVNTNTTFRITVFNKGDKTLYNLSIYELVPSGLSVPGKTSTGVNLSQTMNQTTSQSFSGSTWYYGAGEAILDVAADYGCSPWDGNSGWTDAEFRMWIDNDNIQSNSDYDQIRISFCSGTDDDLWILNMSVCWVNNENPATNTGCTDSLNTNQGEGVTGNWLYSQTAMSVGVIGSTCEFTPWMNYTWNGSVNHFVQWGTNTFGGTRDGNVYETGCSVSRLSRIDGTNADVMDPNWAADAWEAYTYDLYDVEGRNYYPPSNESNTSYTTYNDVHSNFNSVNNVSITIEVDSYNPEASVSRGNLDPDIILEINNGSTWINLGNFSLNLTYTSDGLQTTNNLFSKTTSEATVISAWNNLTYQDIRLKGVYIDYVDGATIDDIVLAGVSVEINGEKDAVNWSIPYIYPDDEYDIIYDVASPATSSQGIMGYFLYYDNGTLADSDSHSVFVTSKGAIYNFEIIPVSVNPLIDDNNTFQINLSNNGEHAIPSGSQFTIDLPNQFTITDIGDGSQSGQSITYTLGSDIAAGSWTTDHNFSANISQGGGYYITVYGTIISHTITEEADIFSQSITGGNTNTVSGGGFSDVISDDASWAGIGHSSGSGTTNMRQDFGIDLSHLGISGSQIHNLTFRFNSCWHNPGGGQPTCSGTRPQYPLSVNSQLYNGSDYESFGPTHTVLSGADNPTYNDGFTIFNHSKTSNFIDSHINSSGYITFRLLATGNDGGNQDAQESTDYVSLDIYYVTDNFTQDVYLRVYDNTSVDFLSREVPAIEASLKNITNSITIKNIYNDTAVKINLTERITNVSCDDPTSPNLEIFAGGAIQGDFDSLSIDTVAKTITWYGLELQINEQDTVTYTVQTPTCGIETLFTDAFNATVDWENLYSEKRNISDKKDIRIAAYNRAYVEYSIVPDEISQDHETTIALRINSSGMRDITVLTNVTLVHPDTCTINVGSISDGGDYNAGTRTLNWSNLGALAIGNNKDVSFDITCNTSGAINFNVTSYYSDIVGELSTNSPTSATIIDITDYITSVWSPSLIEPDGSSTMTLSIENPYNGGSMSNIIMIPATPGTWTKNPSSQSISSISLGGGDSRQFLVNVDNVVSYYNITTNISFTDPNGVSILVNITDLIQVASLPNLVIVREMAPIIGNSGEDMEVRFFIYNNGNDIAHNVSFTEYVNDSFWNGNGDVVSVLDGGTSSPASDTINWSIANISDSNYSLFRYIIEYNGAVTLASPTIWELGADTAGWPYDFGSGSRNSTDFTTYGISGAVDGWDQNDNLIGYDHMEDCTFSVNVNQLRAVDGNSEIMTSCSFGININITDEIYQTIERGGSVNVSFDWVMNPTEDQETEDQGWIKARWHSPTTGEHYLGSDLDSTMTGKDSSYEVATSNDDPDAGDPYSGSFSQDVTSWIEGSGAYYLDFGHKTGTSMASEDITSDFDDINIIILGPKTYYFSSLVNSSDAVGSVSLGVENFTLGVRTNWGSLSFNLTQRVFNVSENFNTTFESLNVGGVATDDDPKLKLAATTNYYDSESPSSYASGSKTITYTEGSIASASQVDNWVEFNSTVADYHVLKAHGLSSSDYFENLFVVSKSGDLIINITTPSEDYLIYQGDPFNLTTNSTSENGNVVGCSLIVLPPGFVSTIGSSSASLGTLTPTTWEQSNFTLNGTNRGYDSILVTGSCTAGTSDQDTVYVNVTYAIRMNDVVLPSYELEAGEILYNITVNSTNLANTTHNIVTSIDIYNSTGAEQSWGPLDSETITNSSISKNQDAIAVFSNSTSGYLIPSTIPTGLYSINATSQPNGLDSRELNTTLRVVRVDTSSSLNATTILPGETVELTVNISSGWTSAVDYDLNVSITYVPDSNKVTSAWSFNPALPDSKNIAAETEDSFVVNITSPSNLLIAKAGIYLLNISVNYTNPNGFARVKFLSENITIEEVYNFTINLTVPSRAPLGLNSTFTVNVTNTGNTPINDMNVSIYVRDALDADPGFSLNPSVRLVDVGFNLSNTTTIEVGVLPNATTGMYNATALGNYSTTTANETREFNVTRDITISNVQAQYSEYEVGDTINHVNISITSVSPDFTYYTTSRAGILNTSDNRQTFGPNLTETSSANIAALSSIFVLLSNNSNGYYIPLTVQLGNYTIKVNTTSNGSVVTYLNGSFVVVLVNVSSAMTDSHINYNETTGFNISILNNFSAGVSFTIYTEVYNNLSQNKTSVWTISTVPASLDVGGKATNFTQINLTPKLPTQVKYGNYSIKATIIYTNPSQNLKTKYTNETVYVNPYKNISASPTIPTMSVGISSNLASLTISNLGNIDLEDMNISVRIYNQSGVLMNWNMSPGTSQLANVSFIDNVDVNFLVDVPAGTLVGNYTANFSVDYNGTDSRYFNVSIDFIVSETIFMNITPSQMELEPGDLLDNITVNLSNINDVDKYNVTSQIVIYDPDNNIVDWGPSQNDSQSTLNLDVNDSVILNWTNSSNGFIVSADSPVGEYTIQSIGNITNEGIVLTFMVLNPKFKLVNVSSTANFINSSIGVNETALLNISVSSGFSSAIDFNITSYVVTNSTGWDFTSYWSFDPDPKTIQVGGEGLNSTSINVTSPADPLRVPAGTYTISGTIFYTDINGRDKNKTFSDTITITEYKKVNITIIPPVQIPLALNSTFTVNITNIGNADFNTTNITFTINGKNWMITPPSSLTTVGFNKSNTASFIVEVPGNESVLADYTANATAYTGQFYAYDSENFTIAQHIFTRNVTLQYNEVEPGTTVNVNVTVENTLTDRNISVFENITIFDSSLTVMSWTPADTNGNATQNSNTSILFDAFNVSVSASTENYSVQVETEYGLLGSSTNSTKLIVSTITPSSTSSLYAVEINETVHINLSLTNLWYSAGFVGGNAVKVMLKNITNSSGSLYTANWTHNATPPVNVDVVSRSTESVLFYFNTSDILPSDFYNFTFEINYTDPNTGATITKYHAQKIGLKIDNIDGQFDFPSLITTGEIYDVNVTVINSGSNQLNETNISIFIMRNNLVYWYFTPSEWTVNDLAKSGTNKTSVNLSIPFTLEPGTYNATMNGTFIDSLGIHRNETILQEFTIVPKIDIDIMADGREHGIVKPNKTITLRIHTEDYAGNNLSGVSIIASILTFDNRNYPINNITDVSGNVDFSLNLNVLEGGYYVNVSASLAGSPDAVKEGVIIADTDKSVLIVKDDNSNTQGNVPKDINDQEYMTLLNSISSVNISSTLHTISIDGVPSFATLNGYDAVVWSLGNSLDDTISNSNGERQNLTLFLQSGGGLVIEAELLTYDTIPAIAKTDPIVLKNITKTIVPTGSTRINTIEHDNASVVESKFNHPLNDGFGGELGAGFTIYDGGTGSSFYKDRIMPNSSLNAVSFATWDNYPAYSAGVYSDYRSENQTSGERVVYYPYSIDGMNSNLMNYSILNSVVWVMRKKFAVLPICNVSQAEMFDWDDSENISIKVYVKDHDAYDILNLVSGTTINVTVSSGAYTDSFPITDNTGFYNTTISFNRTGTNIINISAYKDGHHASFGYCSIFVFEQIPPEVVFVWPYDGYNTTNTSLILKYNASDTLSNITNCSLYINGVLNSTNTSVSETQTNNFSITFQDGIHNWSVGCYDTSSNLNLSINRSLKIDTTGPNITLHNPQSGEIIIGTSTYVINATVTDLLNEVHTVIFDYRENATTTWKNVCNLTASPFNCTWNMTGLSDSLNYQVRVRANDTIGNNASPVTAINIKIDKQPPQLQIWNISVQNESNVTRNSIVIAYSQWFDLFNFSQALIEHNGSGSLVNYSISFINNQTIWANYTLNTSNQTEFSDLGKIRVRTIYANDTSGNMASATPEYSFYFWGKANVTNISHSKTKVYSTEIMTSSCTIRDQDTNAYVQGMNVSFYRNGTLINSNLTNSSGVATITYYTFVPGIYNVSCNISNQTNIYYYAGDDPSMIAYINVTPYPIRPVGPPNNTMVDRDSMSATVADAIVLNVTIPSLVSFANITFKANVTDPSVGQIDIELGYNDSIGVGLGSVTLQFNPNASFYAGNYTWWAEEQYGFPNGTMNFQNYGSLNVTFYNDSINPNSSYVQNETAIVWARLQSLGPETDSQINSSYSAELNATFFMTNTSDETITLDYNVTYYNNTYKISLFAPVGVWNVSLNATASYFFSNDTSRNMTVIGDTQLDVWDSNGTAQETSYFTCDTAVRFYANFTDSSNNSIPDATCNISFFNTSAIMTYNAGLSLYTYNRTFTYAGNYTYSVLCNRTYYTSGFDSGMIGIMALVNVSMAKIITSNLDDNFDAKIKVSNLRDCPQLNIRAFDLIPSDFVAYDYSTNFTETKLISGDYSGNATYWLINLSNLQSLTINYSINGSSDYNLEKAYMFGLDPKK